LLARRLAARRRESEADIAARLARAGAFDVDGCDLVIVNDAGMEEGIQAFLDGLRGFAAGGR
jgi:ribose 1,5-bisphosphokinase PhnN